MAAVSWVTGAWRRFVVANLRAIDAAPAPPPGRVCREARVTIVYLVSALTLAMMSYAVLNHGVQTEVSHGIIALAGFIDPDLSAALAPYQPLLRIIAWSLGAFTFYFAIPALIVRRVFGHRLGDYGLSLRGVRGHLWVYFALFVPVAVAVLMVAAAPDFQAKYPFYRKPLGWEDLVVWELFYALQFFSLEFFFRGFLLHGVKDRLGRHAIFVMVVPYVMIHFSKPLYESLGAVIAGSVLGLLSLRTGSVVGGFLIHVGVAVTMDLAALFHRGF
ncbi:MAG: CPBP family intramembrane metalloprotease [Deltaproteobacteria bacterium]|nr:MAG: CPBP family intramembrane metalloprotease [Deltaproteobacteria bacterium]